jgi:hypothetical protein
MACDDGLTWANQTDSVIKNLTFVGTRLGLYQDTDSLVNGFTYYPGPQTCDLDGWYVTQPSSDLTLDNLTMHGSAGTIGNGNLGNGAINDLSITDETVDPPAAAPGYTLSGPSHGLSVVNVHGMTLTDSSLASGVAANSSINFQPTGSDSDVTISSTTVPRVSFWGVSAKGSTTIGKVTDVGLTDDTFPAVGTAYGSNADTVLEGDSTVTSFTVHGGTWENQQAGTPTGFFAGNGPVTYSIHGLQGY